MNRKIAYLPDVVHFDAGGIARDYGAAALQTCDIAKPLKLRNIAPSMPIWYITTPQGVRDFQPWMKYPLAQETDPMARIAWAVEKNRELGVEWLIRDSAGLPVRMCPNISLGNATLSCPRGKWGWTRGMRFLDAVLAAYDAVIADGRWMNAYQGRIAFEMQGCLASSVELPGKTGPCSREDKGGALSSALIRGFGQFFEQLPLEFTVMFNSSGRDAMTADWVPDAYKLERVGCQQGRERTLADWLAIVRSVSDDSVLHIAPTPSWSSADKARHVRFWAAVGLVYGKWINAGDYNGGPHQLTREEAPEFWRWSEWTPMETAHHFGPLVCRQFRQGVLAFNPTNEPHAGIPAMDAGVIQ